MATVSSILSEARSIFGDDLASVHLPGDGPWFQGLTWSCEVFAQHLKLTGEFAEIGTNDRDAVSLPEDGLAVLGAYNGETMQPLYQIDYARLTKRRPDYRTTTKPAKFWAFVAANKIVLDGDPANASVLLHYLQRPAPIESMNDVLDARLDGLNEQALAYLTACYCLQIAGDAASLERAKAYFGQGMGLAGVKRRVQMPTVSDGGERVSDSE